MKHTPGPWIALPAHIRWHSATLPIFKNGLWHILPEDHIERLPICAVDHADDHAQLTRETAKFDAFLIAASPQLLEALQGILEIGKRDMTNPKYDGYFTFAQEVIAKTKVPK